jgi:hypothetical protein
VEELNVDRIEIASSSKWRRVSRVKGTWAGQGYDDKIEVLTL